MRELDELLGDYLSSRYESASERDKSVFRELLALPDPELTGYLLGGQEPADRGFAHVVDQIRSRT